MRLMGHTNGRWRVPPGMLAGMVVLLMGVAVLGQPATAPAPAAPTPETKATPRKSFLDLLVAGGYFMIPIAVCSLIGVALIIERLVALRRGAVIPPGFVEGLRATFRNLDTDRDAALAYCRAHECPIARVMAVGIRKLPQGPEVAEQAIEDAGANEIFKLRRNLRLLYGVSAVAPMLGLLGTVWGMIDAFQVASLMGLGKAEALATGIYIALVTTLAGLMVAIPVLMMYYYFVGKIERIVGEMNDVSEQFMEHFAGATPRVEPASAG